MCLIGSHIQTTFFLQGTRVLRDFQRRKRQRLKWQERRAHTDVRSSVERRQNDARREKVLREKVIAHQNGGQYDLSRDVLV